MKKLLVIVASMLTSWASAWEPHPSIKAAIDQGDIKGATALAKSMAVGDIYCPASLSLKNFKTIYADTLMKGDLPKYLFGCDSTFLENAMEACKGNTEMDARICVDALMTKYHNGDSAIWMNNSRNFCRNRGTMAACNFFFSYVPFDSLLTYLKIAEKNKLFAPEMVTQRYMKDIVNKRKRTVAECQHRAESIYNNQTTECENHYAHMLHATAYHVSQGGRNPGNNEANRNNCLRDAKAYYQKSMRTCATDPGTEDTYVGSKEVTEKVSQFGLGRAVDNIVHGLESKFGLDNYESYTDADYNWIEIDDYTLELLKYLKKMQAANPKEVLFTPAKTDSTLKNWRRHSNQVFELRREYYGREDLTISKVLINCALTPNIDVLVEKDRGSSIFSCATIQKAYSRKCTTEGEMRDIPISLSGKVVGTYICKNQLWELATISEILGSCSAENNGEKKDAEINQISYPRYGYRAKVKAICDSEWRKPTDLEWSNGLCQRANLYQFVEDRKYVCDTLGWRETTYGEMAGGICNQSMYGKWVSNEQYRRAYYCRNGFICDGRKWKDATDHEKAYGLCDSSKIGLLMDRRAFCSDSGWRYATREESEAGLCSDSIRGTLANGRQSICDGVWRKATDPESKGGLCTEKNREQVVVAYDEYGRSQYYICDNNAWRIASEGEYFGGFCTAEKQGVLGNKMNKRREYWDYSPDRYICKGGNWVMPSVYEDSLGGCNSKNVGAIVDFVDFRNVKMPVVCSPDNFEWRPATDSEKSIRKSCNAKNKDEKFKLNGVELSCSDKNKWIGYFVDSRDNNKYRLTTHGGKVWFDQNLNYKKFFGISCDTCNGYKLYDFDDAQKVCPEGWGPGAPDSLMNIRDRTGRYNKNTPMEQLDIELPDGLYWSSEKVKGKYTVYYYTEVSNGNRKRSFTNNDDEGAAVRCVKK